MIRPPQSVRFNLFHAFGLLLCVGPIHAVGAPTGYTNDFNQAKTGALPEDFLVLNGEFTVRREGDTGWLELAGTPLETYGLLFGPTFSPKTDSGWTVHGNFQALAKGRRFPAFGLGMCGAGGFRLQVTPAKDQLELYKGDVPLAGQQWNWKSGTWTALRLELRRGEGGWQLRGKAWDRTQAEPDVWQINFTSMEEPFAGRSSVWGIPYSGRPIQFDDLVAHQPRAGP